MRIIGWDLHASQQIECLAIDVAGGIRSGCVIEVLTQLVSLHGGASLPRSVLWARIRGARILRWLTEASIETG